MAHRRVYIFLDEGGNFDFTNNGTKYFFLSAISCERPFHFTSPLDDYKYDLIEYGIRHEYFHCADDNPHVRKKVFEIIQAGLPALRIDSLIVEKCKTGPALQDPKQFYPKMLGYLLRWVINQQGLHTIGDVTVITDAIPLNKKREAIEKAVKQTLSDMLPASTNYRILHHQSRSHYGLQIADYCNWAVLRKWEKGDSLYYDQIKHAIKSEFDIFRTGKTKYY